MASLEQPRYAPDEYLALERLASYKSEYLHGEIFAMAGASYEHNLLVANVLGELRDALRRGPCRAVASDLRVQVAAAGMYTYPDVVVICEQPQFADATLDTLLNPSVIVEVLSPSTELYDRGEKFAHYQRLPSLTDYVLVAQDKMRVEHYVRRGTQWVLSILEHPTDTLAFASAGCALPLASLYENIDFLPPTIPPDTADPSNP